MELGEHIQFVIDALKPHAVELGIGGSLTSPPSHRSGADIPVCLVKDGISGRQECLPHCAYCCQKKPTDHFDPWVSSFPMYSSRSA